MVLITIKSENYSYTGDLPYNIGIGAGLLLFVLVDRTTVWIIVVSR